MTSLRVGIIGIDAERGWAREAHGPAVQGVAGLELAAVANRNQHAADAAARALGVERAYGDSAGLIADPSIDIVTVAAPVPAHHDLIVAALQAGKHVITEWPVGTSTAQTEQTAAAAAGTGLHTAVGLQSRLNPAVVHALELVRAGAVGPVLTATVYASTAGFGPVVPEAELYLESPEAGMNLTTIQMAHTVDLAVSLAGELTSVAALTTVQYPQLAVGDPARPYTRTIPDHVLLHGRLAGGGALAVQVVGGRPADDTPFHLSIVGRDGTLTLDGGAPRGFQAGLLALRLDGRTVDVDPGETAQLPNSVVNVACTYAALRDDINHGTRTTADFDHAVRLAHLVDAILASAAKRRTATAPSH